MARLFVAIIVATLLTVLVTAGGEKKSIKKRGGGGNGGGGNGFQIISNANVLQWICQIGAAGATFCTANTPATTKSTTSTPSTPSTPSTTTERGQPAKDTTSTATKSSTTSETTSSTTTDIWGGSSTPTDLELAHWCQYAANGAWLPYNYTFMHLPCVMCHCAANHDILCNQLQCMDLQCVDGTVPRNVTGQCCPQCAYETVSTACRMNGITFPHGTRVTTLESNVECWCQSGNIECRKIPTEPVAVVSTTAAPSKTALLVLTDDSSSTSGMTTYIVIIVICLVLMLGTLLCCGCALAYYYYYHTQQQNMQQAYEQYYNNAGWQPMGADGVIVDEKQAEAAQQGVDSAAHYPTGQSAQYIPPPYAVYNGPYEGKPQGQQQV